MRFSLGLPLVFALFAFLQACTLPPDMTAERCATFCNAQGRTVASYRVGSAVPIFKPRPPVTCDCGAPK